MEKYKVHEKRLKKPEKGKKNKNWEIGKLYIIIKK